MRPHITPSLGRRAAAAALGVTLAAFALAATPASAKPGAPGAGPTARNCVVALQKGINKNPATTCFTTFTQAISFATHGAVTSAPANPSQAATDEALKAKLNSANSAAAVAPQVSLLLDIEYEGLNFGGAWSWVLTGPLACTGPVDDIDYAYDLPSPLWDQISSFQNLFSGTICLTDHYFLQGFTLPRTGFFATSSPVPFMGIPTPPGPNGDNNTRSITLS